MLQPMSEPGRLCVYRFDPGAAFEGGLIAAMERMQLVGDTKLLDALFVGRDPETGALQAVDLGSAGADTSFASLLDFRLDAARRHAITERTLADHAGGVPTALIEAIATPLGPGTAVLAVLFTGPTATVLEEAVARSRGRVVVDEPSEARALADAGPRLQAVAGSPD
jgi:hypothetical protein